MSKPRLFIYDYKFDQYLFLHAVQFKEERGELIRLGHKVIRVSHLPFRHHIGPFSTEEEAIKVKKDLDDNIAEISERDQTTNGESEKCISSKFNYRGKVFYATPDINVNEPRKKKRSHPFCFVQNPLAALNWWLQVDFIYGGTESFDYSPFFATLCHLEEAAIADYHRILTPGGVKPKVYKTDRNYDEVVIRLLACYGIPGLFECDLDPAFSVNHMTTLKWADFKSRIGMTQRPEERIMLLPALEVLKRADHPPVLMTKYILSFRIGIFIKCGQVEGSLLIYEVQLDSNDTFSRQVATLTFTAYQKMIADPNLYRNQVDLIIIPQTRRDLIRIRAEFIQERANKNLRIARKNIALNLMKIMEPREKPRTFQFSYHLAPIIIMETSVLGGNKDARIDMGRLRKWIGEFDLAAHLFQLLSKSRLSGLSWSFHEAPGETAIVSRRMESILTRLFTRSGFKVLVDNSEGQATVAGDKMKETREEPEDVPDSTESDPPPSVDTHEGVLDQQSAMRFSFSGGLISLGKPQIVTQPHTVVNTDFAGFYGAGGISTYELDFCNLELCSKINWKARQLIEQANAVGKGPSVGSIDASPITEEWHQHILEKVKRGRVVRVKNNTNLDITATLVVTNPYIFVEFIEQCMTLRQDLAEITHKEMKSVASFLYNYLKLIISAAYGAICFRKHRYHWPLFGPLVTNGCRKIVTQASTILASKFPEAEQIMIVTDSIAPRFPPKRLTKPAREFLESLGATMKRLYGCDYLNIKVEYFDSLIMSKTNNYATFRKVDGKAELKVHGYTPKHADTPVYSSRAIRQFLVDFLTCFTDTVIVEQNVTTSTTDETKELFRQSLKICFDRLIENDFISPSVPKTLMTCDHPNVESRQEFATLLTVGNAERGHFSYSQEELKNKELLASSYKALGLVQGVVVDYNPNAGFIISTDPKHAVSKEAWERYYLHRQFRMPILDIFQTIFPISDVDDAIRAILPNLQPVALDATSRRTLENRGGGGGGKGKNSKFTSKMIWDRIYARSRAKAPEVKHKAAEEAAVIDEIRDQDPEAGEDSFWQTAGDSLRLLEEKQFVEHRFLWHFEVECLACHHYNKLPMWTNVILDEEEIRHNIALASTCAECKKSIYGDLKLIEEKETQNTVNHINLCCREESSDEVVDFLEAGFDQGGAGQYRRTFAYRLKNYNSLMRFLARIMGNSLLEQQKVELTSYTEHKPLTCRKRPYNYHGLLDETNNIRENPISTLLGVVMKALNAHPFYSQLND